VPASVLEGLGEDVAAQQWRSAIVEPPTPLHHVLVAYEGDETVGFAATGPATPEDLADADEEVPARPGPGWDTTTLAISALLVEPRWGRRGHGSRLLAALTDLAATDGFSRAVIWALDADQATRSFLESAGWARDGIGRLLDMDGTPVSEIRLTTALG
jgi:GNAT superfamily N-acetyltransferase